LPGGRAMRTYPQSDVAVTVVSGCTETYFDVEGH
jgi:hypothetical protein